MNETELTPILGFPGYSITQDGRVWSYKSNRWLRGETVLGYKTYTLCTCGVAGRPLKAARLVLETFVGPCPEGMECRHLDGNPQNDDLNNLAWGTHAENMQDAVVHNSRRGEKNGNCKLTAYKVSWIKQLLDTGRFTNRRIAKVFSVNEATSSSIRNNVNWSWVA